jgi:endopolyphosphatase
MRSYFFSSNSAVDGCAKKREPGYEHMEWLRIQLESLRDRGMKAILMGHVPPARVGSKESWDETCWQKYTLFERQFRDVIVGGLYGHMNIDHFMLQDFGHIRKDTERGRMEDSSTSDLFEDGVGLLEDGEVTVASASDYLLSLREAWAELPSPRTKSNKKSRSKFFDEEEQESLLEWLASKVSSSSKKGKEEKKKYLEEIGGKYAERYAVTHVAPSVVPNYFPTLRIIEYNITGLEHLDVSSSSGSPSLYTPAEQLLVTDVEYADDEDYLRDVETTLRKKHKGKKNKKPKTYKFKVPDGPSKSAPPGPAYSPQTLTWTRYIQYFANLTQINNDFVDPPPDLVDSRDADRTSINDVFPQTIFGLEVSSTGEIENNKWNEGKHKKHQGKQPRPEPHPKEFVFEVEYDTRKDKGFADLTVRRWVEYARKIGQTGGKASAEVSEVEFDHEAEEDGNDEFDADGKKHKKHKHKKGKHHKKRKASKEWVTFVKRAFVGTMDPHEIKQLFSSGPAVVKGDAQAQEVMEL